MYRFSVETDSAVLFNKKSLVGLAKMFERRLICRDDKKTISIRRDYENQQNI